jgi:hypothetical protein
MAELLLMVHIPLGDVNVPILITRSRREGWCLTTHETVDEGTKHASDSAQRSSVAFLYRLFVDCGRRPSHHPPMTVKQLHYAYMAER